jgi:S-adenosyl methyltransferase
VSKADRAVPNGIDVTTPNVARMYDFYLGGKDNYAADREAARRVLGAAPEVPLAALENREFVKRALQFLVREARIAQFIDVGPGLPTRSNVHEVVRQHNPEAHVVYMDNDPVVINHGQALLEKAPGVAIIDEDLREPEHILSNPALRKLIDFGQPVALCMTLVLHFIPESGNPYGIVACLREALCPGSYLVISHVTGDGRDSATLAEITSIYDRATAPLVMRSHDEITEFFAGFELVEPGVVFLSQWRSTGEFYSEGGTRWAYAGVGRKPEKTS